MALYNVCSRPFISRSGAIAFAARGMAVGGACPLALVAVRGGLAHLAATTPVQWLALAHLALICGALVFFLWAFALSRTTPTLVAISVAVKPLTAFVCAALLLSEPIGAGAGGGLRHHHPGDCSCDRSARSTHLRDGTHGPAGYICAFDGRMLETAAAIAGRGSCPPRPRPPEAPRQDTVNEP